MRDRKAAGVDAIEILNDDVSWSIKAARIPLMKPDVLSAIIDEAHRQGLKVFAHAPMLEAAKQVLRVLQPPRFYDAFTSPIGVKQFEFFFNNADFTKQHLPYSAPI